MGLFSSGPKEPQNQSLIELLESEGVDERSRKWGIELLARHEPALVAATRGQSIHRLFHGTLPSPGIVAVTDSGVKAFSDKKLCKNFSFEDIVGLQAKEGGGHFIVQVIPRAARDRYTSDQVEWFGAILQVEFETRPRAAGLHLLIQTRLQSLGLMS